MPPSPSALELFGYYVSDSMRSLGRLALRRVRRTPNLVTQQYDSGHWRKILDNKRWERSESLIDFLRQGSDDKTILCLVDGRPTKMLERDYFDRRLADLPKFIAQHADGARSFVDLGTGTGTIPLILVARGYADKCIGLDVSPNGIAVATKAAETFGLSDRLTFDLLDLTDPNHPNYRLLTGQTVVTHFSLEQIPTFVGSVVRQIASMKPRRVIHIEPFSEFRLSPRGITNWLYVHSVDYQRGLAHELRAMEQEGEIVVHHRGTLPFAGTLHNEGFVAVWSPR